VNWIFKNSYGCDQDLKGHCRNTPFNFELVVCRYTHLIWTRMLARTSEVKALHVRISQITCKSHKILFCPARFSLFNTPTVSP
jgi:hypothetical protein